MLYCLLPHSHRSVRRRRAQSADCCLVSFSQSTERESNQSWIHTHARVTTRQDHKIAPHMRLDDVLQHTEQLSILYGSTHTHTSTTYTASHTSREISHVHTHMCQLSAPTELSHGQRHNTLLHTATGMQTGTTNHHLPLKFLLTAFKSASVISSRPFFLACSSAWLHSASSMGSSASSSATTAP